MRSTRIVALALSAVLAAGHLQAQVAVLLEPKPAIYIAPTPDGFEVLVAAAIAKKEVPARIVDNPESAHFTLKAGQVESQQESTGSVQLIDREGTVRWSYAVNKGRGAKNRQSMAESIAKHLKNEFFHK